MKVKELMSTKLTTVSPNDKLDRVFFLYNFENFRHLPVLEKNKLVSKHSPKKDDYFLSRMNVSLENLDESSCIQNNIYFFRREEDARGYVEAFWSGAVYPIYITKVIGVGNKGFDMSRKD